LGLEIDDDDFEVLVLKYGQAKEGRMDYRAFADSMENGMLIICT